MRNSRWLVPVIVLLVVLGGAAGVLAASSRAVPFRVLSHYPVGLLAEEAATMHECAECHTSDTFHRCTTCHDDHGALDDTCPSMP